MTKNHNSRITTRDVTRGAMAAAIYAILLFLNQQTALGVETTMPWLFIFPIYLYAAGVDLPAALTACLAMALETFLFGSFTTWFYSWSSLLTGLLAGAAIHKGVPGGIRLTILFVCQFLGNLATTLVWAGLFGMDFTEDIALIRRYIPWLDLKVFIILFAALLALMTAICVHLVGQALMQRMNIPCPPITPVSRIRPKGWAVWTSVILTLLFLACQDMVIWGEEVRNLLLLGVIPGLVYLDYLGAVRFLQRCVSSGHRAWAPLAVIGAFVPGLQLIWILQGALWGLKRT